MKCCGCRKNFRHPPSTSGKRPSTSTNAAFPAHRLAHQVAAHQLSRAYRLAYRIFAYQSECLGLRGNRLGNRPFGNQSKTAVPVLTPLLTSLVNQSSKRLIPWKPRLGNTRRKSAVSLLQRLLQRLGKCGISCLPRCLPRCLPGCLPWAKNARFHGYLPLLRFTWGAGKRKPGAVAGLGMCKVKKLPRG